MKNNIQVIREAGIKGLCKKAEWYHDAIAAGLLGGLKYYQNVGTMKESALNGAGQMALALPGFVGGLANGTYQGIKDGSWSSALNGLSDGQEFVDSHIGVPGTDLDLKHWRDWLERGQTERELEFRARNDMSPDHRVFKKPREGMEVQDIGDSFGLGALHGSHLAGGFLMPYVGVSKVMRPLQTAKNMYKATAVPARGARALGGAAGATGAAGVAGARNAWSAAANPLKHPVATGLKGYMGYNYLQQAKDTNQQLNERNRYALPVYYEQNGANSSPKNTPYATPQPVFTPRYVAPKRRPNYTY